MRRRSPGHGFVSASFAALLLACAGGSGGGPSGGSAGGSQGGGSTFPSPAELEKLGNAKIPEAVFARDIRRVSEWKLAGPFPERIEASPYSDGSAWSALLDEAARRRAGLAVPTEAMYCAARELGRFFLATGGEPADSLRRFITTRCNAPTARVGFAHIAGPVPPGRSDEEILAAWRPSVEKSIEATLAGGPRVIGIWFGREAARAGDGAAEPGDRGVVMIAYGSREVHVEPIATIPDEAGRLVIRGEALGPVDGVSALANRGEYGVEECEAMPGVVLPRFAFVCSLDPQDRAALVSVSTSPRDSILGHSVLYVQAWPQGEPEDTYREVAYTGSRIAGDVSSLGADLTELVNEVRERAGFRPLRLDPGQSETAAGLAPPYFAALFERVPHGWADLVALGMLAGWDVDGTVQTGHFTSSWIAQDPDLGRLVSEALEEPAGRETLLAPDSERIAVGALREGEGEQTSLAVLFGTYELFSERDHARSVRFVIDRLTRERAKLGRSAPEEVVELGAACNDAAVRVTGGAEPKDAMDRLLRTSVDTLGRSVTGWVAEVNDLGDLNFPDEYLKQRDLSLAVAVSHHQEKGEPWGRYVVMLVIVAPESRSA